jgi:hypothetical protein
VFLFPPQLFPGSPTSQELIDLTAPTFVKELDYEIEASNQRRFAQTVEDCELIRDTIVVPEILFANRHLGLVVVLGGVFGWSEANAGVNPQRHRADDWHSSDKKTIMMRHGLSDAKGVSNFGPVVERLTSDESNDNQGLPREFSLHLGVSENGVYLQMGTVRETMKNPWI